MHLPFFLIIIIQKYKRTVHLTSLNKDKVNAYVGPEIGISNSKRINLDHF